MSTFQQNQKKDKFLQVEKEILKDTNARGDLQKLAKWGNLEKIALHLASLRNSSSHEKCLLLTGFPCIKNSKADKNEYVDNEMKETKNIQETDGIAGVVAIARALGPEKCIIGIEGEDNINCENFEDSASYAVKCVLEDLGEETSTFSNKQTSCNKKFQILSLPTVRKLQAQKQAIFNKTEVIDQLGEYSILAIEKAGYSMSNNTPEKSTSSHVTECCRAYTMKARDITLDCAPADLMKTLWDNATLRIAIGDGGNELGLGLVHDLTCQHIPLGNQIACMPEFSADHLLISGVSNWGGYAIGLGILSMENDKEVCLDSDIISEKSELVVAKTLKELKVCDGVTGEYEHCTVDGIDLDRHMMLLRKLRTILI